MFGVESPLIRRFFFLEVKVMKGTLFTIGYVNHTIPSFISALKAHSIAYVFDVRSIPYSKNWPEFNKENLKGALVDSGIKYYFLGKQFGARRIESELYSSKGYVDFNLVIAQESFQEAMDATECALNNGHNVVLMCSEKDPLMCHRCIMLGKAFKQRNIICKHIMEGNALVDQVEVEQKLVNMYFNISSPGVFSFLSDSKIDDYIEKAYSFQNAKIGWKQK